ncbi:VTT domain-containing protein [Zoogloeaceae bacterium G21618-S1]|nr:VTT domain-containing protein [Zoogloeaceae bacterium G21618-S1]
MNPTNRHPIGSAMRRYRQLLTVVLFLAILFGVAEGFGLRDHLSLAYLQAQLTQHPLGGLLAFMALFALGNLIQIPGWVFLASAVLALGKLWGGVATYIAASASCIVTFVAVRAIGGDALQKLDNPTATRLLGHLHARPVGVIVALRTLFQTLPALNYTLALSGVGFRPYVLGTLLGLPLPIAAYCVFFDYLSRLWR